MAQCRLNANNPPDNNTASRQLAWCSAGGFLMANSTGTN
jgi:hypothetical protein